MYAIIAMSRSTGIVVLIVAGLFLLGMGYVIMFILGLSLGTAGFMKDYEEGVVFRLGRQQRKVITGGAFNKIPLINEVIKVDMRDQDVVVGVIEVVLAMNIRVKIRVKVQIRVVDSKLSVSKPVDFDSVVANRIDSAWQRELGNADIDVLVKEQAEVLRKVTNQIASEIGRWGIELTLLAVETIEFPPDIEQSLVREAAQVLELRGDKVRAAGELQLAPMFLAAAKAWVPDGSDAEVLRIAFELRRFATLEDMRGGGVIISEPTARTLPPPALPSPPASTVVHDDEGGDT